MKQKLLPAFLLFTGFTFAQVGVGTTAPRAALEVNSASNGFLAPQIGLTTTTASAPVVNPAGGALPAGTIVYNTASVNDVTPGYYYWNGTVWVRMASGATASSNDWSLTGNAGTSVGTNFLGTTDNQSLAVRTNNAERLRVLNNGQVAVNQTAPNASFRFSSYSTDALSSVVGISSGSGNAVYGQNTGTNNAIAGLVNTAEYMGVRGSNLHTSGTGVIGGGNNLVPNYLVAGSGGAFTGLTGVYGNTASSAGAGAHGRNTNINGVGVLGESTAARSGTSEGTGVRGTTNQYAGSGVEGGNFFANGTGVVGWGNGLAPNIMDTGSGGAFTGNTQAIYGINFAPGVGQVILGQDNSGAQWSIGHWTGAAYRKILGDGTVSTIVDDLDGNKVVMNCPETPENLFMDYGIAKLVNGRAHVQIDPILSKNIIVNDKHPLKVFIQLEGDCNGVYVTNKTATGFDVIELQSGRSSISFSYNIVATMGDQTVTNDKGEKRVAKYDTRWEKAPEYKKPIQLKKREFQPIETKEAVNTKILK